MLMGRTFARPERMRMFFKQYLNEMVQLGVNSIGIVLLISFFIGAVITIQIKLNIKADVVKILMNIRKQNGEVKRQEAAKITGAALEAINSVDGGKKISTPGNNQTVVNDGPKVGRNDPCPCGSGKKYKNCCGRNQ